MLKIKTNNIFPFLFLFLFSISFCMQFNTEFPLQEMNFPTLVVTTPIYLFSSVRFATVK